MGFFYIGAKTNNYKNGYMKIGETNQKYLSSRIAQIRKKQGNFVVLAYLEISESTSAMTRAIESYVRFKLERQDYEMVQNDHFVFLGKRQRFAAADIHFVKEEVSLLCRQVSLRVMRVRQLKAEACRLDVGGLCKTSHIPYADRLTHGENFKMALLTIRFQRYVDIAGNAGRQQIKLCGALRQGDFLTAGN